MHRRNALTFVVAAAITMTCTVLTTAPVSAVATSDYYWKWSDGSRAQERVFDQARFRGPTQLPAIIVTSRPANPGASVRLEFRDGSRWILESNTHIGSDGKATVRVNPLCEANRWCDSPIDYRLRVDGQTATLAVDYRAIAPISDGNSFT